MIWHHYGLSNTVLKTNEPLTLWKADRGSVEIGKDTLVVAITLEGRPQGYIFGGNGKLILDAIVETEQGAVGKPVEQRLTEPFLMLGNAQVIESRSSSAGEAQKDFLTKAGDVFTKFFREGEQFGPSCHDHKREGLVLAFMNDFGNFDILIPHGSKIVYKSKQMVFISDENRTIMKNPEHTVVSNNGRCITVRGH